jgi:hypothetical protein
MVAFCGGCKLPLATVPARKGAPADRSQLPADWASVPRNDEDRRERSGTRQDRDAIFC